ncbi:MAG TPA: D-sedoheptulose 7-phosphate isomerase [Phycisphaerae bacterium]|nr:D-sedoheptulose 7-phosphate isomerase [Phycisphaerae bacterium]HNU44964.1 D-sedoheptulose 7-phosphate isomerase [Phycisphaerae bacterium]
MNESMQEQFAEHQRAVAAAVEQIPLLARMADRLAECFRAGGRLHLLGNGGSAADAQHIAAELVGRFKQERPALPAVALTTDTSILTAVGNDLGFEAGFDRQVEALVTARDAVWALSTSGSSPNVLRAVERARRVGALCLGFTGRKGRRLRELCDLCFVADHDDSDRIQEVHQLAYHLICERIERKWVAEGKRQEARGKSP